MKLPILLNGALVVSESFCALQDPTPVANPQIDYVGEGTVPDFESLVNTLASIQTTTQDPAISLDGDVAILLHKSLPLARREAANRRFWHYIAVVAIPQYVAWRWYKGETVPRERYLGSTWRNAFARLWWIAELTHIEGEDDPYVVTRKAANSQEFFQWATDILICGNAKFLRAMAERSFENPPLSGDLQIRHLFKTMNGFAATHVIDLLDAGELKKIIDEHASVPKT